MADATLSNQKSIIGNQKTIVTNQRSIQANQKTIPGQKLFELYDTYGYPLDLAADSARDKGLTLDLEGFQAALAEQRELASSLLAAPRSSVDELGD